MSGAPVNSRRARSALSYWQASRRLLRDDRRMGLSPATADLVLIEHALAVDWPRLSVAATHSVVLVRRARERAAEAATSAGRSKSRGRRRRRRAD